MRIIIYDKYDSSKMSGQLKFSERLMEYLQAHGHQVWILRYSKEKNLPKNIFPIPFYIAEPRSYIFLPSEKTYEIVKRYLVRLKPDIVYAYCGMSPFDFILPSLCHRLHIPVTGVWHQDFSDTLSPVQVAYKSILLAYVPFIQALDMLHVFSDKLKKFYTRNGIDSKKIIVLPNGVNPDFYGPGPSKFGKKHHIKTGILFLGRLTFQKTPEVLMRSFLAIHPPADTKLVIAGGGDLLPELKKKYVDPRIIFTGLITDEEKKRDIIRSCKIMVQPSMIEGMSLALLESMSCGLAAITSDAGNNTALLRNAGTIIPIPRLSSDLPDVLESYLAHPEDVNAKGIQARKNILLRHVEKKIHKKLVGAFQKTIAQYHQPSKTSGVVFG